MRELLRASRLPLGIALGIGVALRLVLLFQTPIASESTAGALSSFNDEFVHASYTSYLLLHHSLPPNIESITGDRALQQGNYENYQPPLYYWIHAFVAQLSGASTIDRIVVSGRWLSLFFSLGFFVFYLLIARELRLPQIQITAGLIFLLLSGVIIRQTVTAGNDSLFWLLAGGLLWSAIRISGNSKDISAWIFFSAFSAAGIYTKLTMIMLLPVPLLVLLNQRNLRVLLYWLPALLLIILLTLPVWLRNLSEFGGLIPLSAGFGDAACRVPGVESLAFAIRSAVFPWSELWGGVTGLGLMLIPVLAVLIYRIRARFFQSPGWETLSLAFLIVTAAFIWLNFRYDQAEARYLFAAWPFIALYVAKPFASGRSLWILLLCLLCPYVLFIL